MKAAAEIPAAVSFGAPSMARDLEVRVLCVSRPQRALAKRKGVTARGGLEEAWSKLASRRTGTGYKAWWLGASGPKTAKLYRPVLDSGLARAVGQQ